ncbi:MAG TPA: LysM peptidoglycan-binding domain-containing protein [Bacteroidia bacterium]|nr:LysM peptidoglycan-binding domain-containing protein [Bacteroidia bacterium]
MKKSTKTEVIDGKKYYLHTVEKGQTLYAIAKAYDYTVNDVLVENPDAMNGIKPGQVLKIPYTKAVAVVTPVVDTSTYSLHKVEQGETVYGLTKKFNVTEDELLKLNPDIKNGLKVGEEIKIPKTASAQVTNVIPTPVDTNFVLHQKDIYNVALLIPLQLANSSSLNVDDIVAGKSEFPAKADAAVRFYQGALLALDSMKKAGMKIKLHVYDVDDIDSAKVPDLLAKPEFSSMDLIIGPLSPAPFFPVAEWANAHKVAVVSPVSPANKVLFKEPYALKALPSISTQMDQLADYLAANNRTDNIILLNSGNAKDIAAGNAFRTSINTLLYPDGKDSVLYAKGIATVESSLKKDKLNVIVVASNNQASVTDIVRMLNDLADDYPIMLYGTSTWMTFDNIDFEYLEKLQFHYVAPYYVDYDSSATVKHFISRYDYYFHGYPNAYSFAGYDVTMFFLKALNTYGTSFYDKSDELTGNGLQQDFHFVRAEEDSGFENEKVRIVRVLNYHLQRLQ